MSEGEHLVEYDGKKYISGPHWLVTETVRGRDKPITLHSYTTEYTAQLVAKCLNENAVHESPSWLAPTYSVKLAGITLRED